jgi:hypothetical protein
VTPARHEISIPGGPELLDAALRAGLLDSVTVRSLDGLARLRTLARTSPGLTARQAEEFGVLADAVSYTMRRAGQPGQAAPGQPVPGQPAPGQPLPGQAAAGEPPAWPAS